MGCSVGVFSLHSREDSVKLWLHVVVTVCGMRAVVYICEHLWVVGGDDL